MPRYYICEAVGDGSDDSPFRPVGAEHVDAWSAMEGREDALSTGPAMLMWCEPTPAQHEALVATPGVEYVGEE